MNKRTIIILTVAIVALIGWSLRVYVVNEGVAKKYEIKTYHVGDTISLGNATFKVTKITQGKVKKEHGYESFPLTAVMEVRNTTDKDTSITGVIEAKLAYGMDDSQTMEGNYDVSKLRKLPPNEVTTVTLIYHVKPEYERKAAKLYINQNLYEKRVLEKYKQGKRFGIAINL
jgi:hypothetical protein